MSPSSAQTEQHNAGNDPWYQQNGKENQRPPVFFPEDYIAALKKFSKFGKHSGSNKSIYDTIDETKAEKAAAVASKSRTLPLSKSSEYKWAISKCYFIPIISNTIYQFCGSTEALLRLQTPKWRWSNSDQSPSCSWNWGQTWGNHFKGTLVSSLSSGFLSVFLHLTA